MEVFPGATETALDLPDGLSENQWREAGEKLGRAHRAAAWWIGDWINYGEDAGYVSRGKYDKAEDITRLSTGHLKQCASVARRFKSYDRSYDLTWTHYFRARALTDAETWLSRAEEAGWSVRDLQAHAQTAPRTKIFPEKRHAAFIEAAEVLIRHGQRWDRAMTDTLAPPQAEKQLRRLYKAQELLAQVIEAVEYRAAKPHSFMGR
jgi:hypothetical protein